MLRVLFKEKKIYKSKLLERQTKMVVEKNRKMGQSYHIFVLKSSSRYFGNSNLAEDAKLICSSIL